MLKHVWVDESDNYHSVNFPDLLAHADTHERKMEILEL